MHVIISMAFSGHSFLVLDYRPHETEVGVWGLWHGGSQVFPSEPGQTLLACGTEGKGYFLSAKLSSVTQLAVKVISYCCLSKYSKLICWPSEAHLG